jgi:hypothetical protein
MTEDSSLSLAVAGQRCDQCGARLTEIVTECPFCGARLLNLVSLEDETRAFLESTEIRMTESITGHADGLMVPALFSFLISGPACYLVLDSYTGVGLLARIGLAVLAWFSALVFFGWQINLRGERAEKHAWRTVVQPAVRAYLARKGFSDSEFMVLAGRLLAEESQLRKMLLRRLAA